MDERLKDDELLRAAADEVDQSLLDWSFPSRFESGCVSARERLRRWQNSNMRHPKTADLEALLEALVQGGVEFVVVGGVAGTGHLVAAGPTTH